jgi:hypothetical protein
MKKGLRAADVEALIREIQRYLSYVDAFRSDKGRPPPAEREGGNGNA